MRHKEPSAKTLCIGCEEQQGCPEPVLMESCRRSVTLELLHISVPSPQNSREEAVDVKGGSEGHSSARTLIPVHSAVFGHWPEANIWNTLMWASDFRGFLFPLLFSDKQVQTMQLKMERDELQRVQSNFIFCKLQSWQNSNNVGV